MTEFNPPYCIEAESQKHPASIFRKAIGSLINPAGGVLAANSLQVTQHGAGNMSVDINGGTPPLGEIWVPGTSAPTQGMYFCWNDGVVNKPIAASSEAAPRIDTVIARVFDAEYAGAENKWELEVLTGKPEAGATLENRKGAAVVPASSLVLAYVLVPAEATTIATADILNISKQFVGASNLVAPSLKSIIAVQEERANVAYGTLTTPDEVTVVLPENGLLAVTYQAQWQAATLNAAARAALFINANQLKVQHVGAAPATQAAVAQEPGAGKPSLLFSSPQGLVGLPGVEGADVATGQAAGAALNGAALAEVGGAVVIAGESPGTLGGPFYIDNLPAGTYNISVQFKVDKGPIIVKNRRLRAWPVP